ncbi:MAG: peptide-methionine (S)-S-oxide reductase [Legionella sp. 21-45-4]|nr:MAG: peptide-methionine (S)-S-oxide reductase [Legionella sp. 21-45-4]
MMDLIDKLASLTPAVKRIMCDKGTEHPFAGAYNEVLTEGTYLCRRCGLALFRANSQFTAGCGWPSFDAGIADAVAESPDEDGLRTEIHCRRCAGHLGHVFVGELLTLQNRRYCVNSLAIDFVEDNEVVDTEEALVAGGRFWGVDYFLSKLPGVLKVEVGYTGGHVDNPSYHAVCQDNTGHYEAVRIIFDCNKVTYHAVLTRFFEIHDPTQARGQGPDIGQQYQSAVFYYNDAQHVVATALIAALSKRGYAVATKVIPVSIFWIAEASHQHYYESHHKLPYCHQPVERFK